VPLGACLAQTGADGILEDVAAELGVVAVVLDQLGRVPTRPERPEALPTVVEGLCVHAVHVLHSAREVGLGRLYDEVVVRRHQAVGVQAPREPPCGPLEQVEEAPAVEVVGDDRAACNAA